MTMHKALHLKNYVDRLYVSRKETEENLAALKRSLMNRYNDSKTTWVGIEQGRLRDEKQQNKHNQKIKMGEKNPWTF